MPGEGSTTQMVATTMTVEYQETIEGHITVLDRTFKTYGWGSNDQYKAGIDFAGETGYNSYSLATPIDLFSKITLDEGVQLQRVAAGGSHSGAFDTNGIV